VAFIEKGRYRFRYNLRERPQSPITEHAGIERCDFRRLIVEKQASPLQWGQHLKEGREQLREDYTHLLSEGGN
jgi:hypothetical protein